MASGETKLTLLTSYLDALPDTALLYIVVDGVSYKVTKAALLAGISGGGIESISGDIVDNTDSDNPIILTPNQQQVTESGRTFTENDGTTQYDFEVWSGSFGSKNFIARITKLAGSWISQFNFKENGLSIVNKFSATEVNRIANDQTSGVYFEAENSFGKNVLAVRPRTSGSGTANFYTPNNKVAANYTLSLIYEVVTSAKTAEYDANYTTSSATNVTYTDPSTSTTNRGYYVFSLRGTSTIGGVAYPQGSLVYRFYNTTLGWTTKVITTDLTGYATETYVDNKVAGLLDLRGNFDASGNVFPSSGGSGTAGAILKGDFWYVSVAGTLNGQAVNIGDSIYALIDSPTSSDWEILQSNLTYVPEDFANKTDTMAGNTASSTKYLSAKGTFDWVTALAWLTDVIFGTWMNGLTAKNTLVDADGVVSFDSADSNKSKKTSWLNVWANFLKPKADLVYQNSATAIVDVFEKAILKDNYFWFRPNNSLLGYSDNINASSFSVSGNALALNGYVPFSTSTTPGNVAFKRRHDGLQLQGLILKETEKFIFTSNVTGQRFAHGFTKNNQFSAPTNVDQTTLTNIAQFVQLDGSANIQAIHNDASGTATVHDFGSNFPANDSQYTMYLSIEQTATSYIFTIVRVTNATGVIISDSYTATTNIMDYTSGVIQICTWITNNAQTAVASYKQGTGIGKFNT